MNRKQRRAANRQGAAPEKQGLGKREQMQATPRAGVAGSSSSLDAAAVEARRLHRAGRPADAEQLYRRILAVDRSHRDSLYGLGLIAAAGGHHAAAVSLFARVTLLDPANAALHVGMADAFKAMGRRADAVAGYRRGLSIVPDQPDAATNLGNVLHEEGHIVEAASLYRRVLAVRPGDEGVHNNLGVALKDTGDLAAAEVCYRRALRLRPDFAAAHQNLGYHGLLAGRLTEGWPAFDWRWQGADGRQGVRAFRQPRWIGQSRPTTWEQGRTVETEHALAGRTVLLHAEMGFGDTLQFTRYVPLVAARAGRVVVEVQRPLLGLLSTLKETVDLVAVGDPLPPFDLHCPLVSLPRAFATTRETIPPPLARLTVEPARIAAWRARLPSARLCIGIAWASNPAHGLAGRSLPLAMVAPLARLPGVHLVSLQKNHGLDQLESVPAHSIQTLGAGFDSGADAFLDTAAVMHSLDLVIAIDSAVAHLAGTLGHPLWVVLPAVPHWIWGLEGETSPWYPSARLFRQSTPGDWGDVMDRVTRAVAAVLEVSGSSAAVRPSL